MKNFEQTSRIIDLLKEKYPAAPCALHYEKDYELLVAVRLSAQCTDARVNLVTPVLFKAFPNLHALANANISEVERIVHSCGFYQHKARDIVLACQMLENVYDGVVPNNMEALLKIPGVGRKTANLLLGDLYQKEAYVCDTHCIRISARLGLTDGTTDPVKCEMQLRKIIPPEESSAFCHRIVLYGREICKARNPLCNECSLQAFCKFFETR